MEQIRVSSIVKAPISKVWEKWTKPEHIVKWNSPSPEWHTPRAENDLKENGKFLFRMEARDGSMGFDFEGVYDIVNPLKQIAYTMGDGRKVNVTFTETPEGIEVVTVFDAENQNSLEVQQNGWQAISDSFANYASL